MRRSLTLFLLAALLTVGATMTPQAEAQYPYLGGYGGYLNRNGYSDLALPYFSQFPPVYYSHPVARPYGWSPYAYPPTVLTPAVAGIAPGEMINPFVVPQQPEAEELPARPEPETKIAPENSARRVQPKMIYNPYVVTEEFVSDSLRD